VVRRASAQLLTRFSGRPRALDAVVITRDAPEDLDPDEAEANDTFEDGLLDGIAAAGRSAVGVERTDAERSSIELFSSHDISTVDNVDLVAGRVALVSVLLGADGSFGVKDSADELLPDLISPGGRSG
jgi:Copper transport outer membrane protein, MctB